MTQPAELLTLAAEAAVCTRCTLAKTRSRVVFGAGSAPADLMLVGEAPDVLEQETGLPLAGDGRRVLADLLHGIGLTVDDVFITNVVMCHPPRNRDLEPTEIEACAGYFYSAAKIVKPRVVVTLGAFTTRLLSGRPAGIATARGKELEVRLGPRLILLYPLFEPALAVQVPSTRRLLVKDFARIPELLERELDDPYANAEDADEIEQLGLFTTSLYLERA